MIVPLLTDYRWEIAVYGLLPVWLLVALVCVVLSFVMIVAAELHAARVVREELERGSHNREGSAKQHRQAMKNAALSLGDGSVNDWER